MSGMKSTAILSLLLVLIVDLGGGEEWGDEECVNPLGMQSGKINASQITASSSFDVKSVGPQNARIRTETAGGSWCPQRQISTGVKEYLEIDFIREYRISQTETQGRFGNGLGREFVEQFQLEYWRDSLSRWISYKDHLGRTIFQGNANTYKEAIQKLQPPIIGSRIRFIPHSLHIRTVCMRVEVYGCVYTDGIVYYECPQGYWKNNPEVDLRDLSYDGQEDDSGILRGGLGLLVDSRTGPSDFFSAQKSNMWIGWDNQSTPIRIGFQFDQLRKFQLVSIHVNNFVSQGAQVFASAVIYFSMDGKNFSEFPIRWSPKRNIKNETSLLVDIPLKGRLATYIRLEFYHSNHWLLFSEISFLSDTFTGNITDDVLSLNYAQDVERSGDKKVNVLGGSSSDHSTGAIVGLIAGSLSIFVLLSIVTLVFYVMRRNRRNTKLVGVMSIGMTPKSMSIGLGLGGPACSSDDQLSSISQGNVTKNKGSGSSSSMNILNGGNGGSSSCKLNKKIGKIALCDMDKPVSISGETDSDESMYHELVFGRGGNSGDGRPSVATVTSKKNWTNTSGLGKTTSKNGSISISSASILESYSGPTDSSESGYMSASQQQLGRKGSANSGTATSRKVKYQRVNHATDFSDFMGVRSIHDEMSYFTPNMTPSHFQASSPSTPMSGLRSSTSNKVPLAHSHCSIETPGTASVHLPTTFRLPIFSQHQHQHQHTYSNSPPTHMTLDPNKVKGGNIFATPSSSKPINLGYFNSPRIASNTNRRPTNINSATAACIANNNQAYGHHLNNNGSTMGMGNTGLGDINTNSILGNGLHPSSSSGSSKSSGSANMSAVNPNCNSSHLAGGVGALTFMKSSGMSSSTGCGLTYGGGAGTSGGCSSAGSSSSAASSVSNNILGPGPLSLCGVSSNGGGGGGGESNYYAATDIFQVSDKHFDRF